MSLLWSANRSPRRVHLANQASATGEIVMKTVVVLSSNPAFPEAISSGVDASAFKIVHRVDVTQAEPLLRANIVDLCILDLQSDQLQGSWAIEQLQRMSPA